jgi:hypothetical protein
VKYYRKAGIYCDGRYILDFYVQASRKVNGRLFDVEEVGSIDAVGPLVLVRRALVKEINPITYGT